MPLWKQMVEAFGRAAERPGAGKLRTEILKHADDFDVDGGRRIGTDLLDRMEQFRNEVGFKKRNTKQLGRDYDWNMDQITEERLQDDFTDIIDDIANNAMLEQHKLTPNDFDRAWQAADAVRESIIYDLQHGADISDVLAKYRGRY